MNPLNTGDWINFKFTINKIVEHVCTWPCSSMSVFGKFGNFECSKYYFQVVKHYTLVYRHHSIKTIARGNTTKFYKSHHTRFLKKFSNDHNLTNFNAVSLSFLHNLICRAI